MTTTPVLRIARPTDDLEALLLFYREGLGLSLLFRFEDHDGFDGMMLGQARRTLPFRVHAGPGTRCRTRSTQDNLLVFYLPDAEEWKAAVQRMQAAGFAPVSSFNPYWDREGMTFEDPDGYRVVLQRAAWMK